MTPTAPTDIYDCLPALADALFELEDAVSA